MTRFATSRFAASIFATPRSLRALALSTVCAASLFATQAMAIDVANQTDWNTVVAAVAAAGANSTVSINITSGFTLSSSLAQLQTSNSNVVVNITGNNQTINGASSFQGIVVNGANAPTVNISSLAVTNTAALGGNGQNGQNGYFSAGLSYGSGGGGGGGLGAGGGLMVGSGAHVTLAAVTFTGNTATGGHGGNGGSAQNTAADPVNGGNGGAGGAANNNGGGGGAGGTGGHAGTQGTTGTAGAALGDGGVVAAAPAPPTARAIRRITAVAPATPMAAAAARAATAQPTPLVPGDLDLAPTAAPAATAAPRTVARSTSPPAVP
jgi:hypothetical protein